MNYRKTFNRITLIAWSTIAAILIMWSIALQTAEAKTLFEARIDYDTDYYPNSFAIDDLNGDGNLDLVVANGGYKYYPSSVSVFLGCFDQPHFLQIDCHSLYFEP